MGVALLFSLEAVVAGQPLDQAFGPVVEVHDLDAVFVLGVKRIAMEERSQVGGQRDVETQDQDALVEEAVGEDFGAGHQDQGFTRASYPRDQAVTVFHVAGKPFLVEVEGHYHTAIFGEVKAFGYAFSRGGLLSDHCLWMQTALDGVHLVHSQRREAEGDFEHIPQPLHQPLWAVVLPIQQLIPVSHLGLLEEVVDMFFMGLGFGDVAHHSGGSHGEDKLALVVALGLAQDGIAFESFCGFTEVTVGLAEGRLMTLDHPMFVLDLEELLPGFKDIPCITALHLDNQQAKAGAQDGEVGVEVAL